MRIWIIGVRGPQYSPYENGVFLVEIKFQKEHPTYQPHVYFKTKIYHPNIGVDNNGYLCLDYVKDNWSPDTMVRDIINQIQNLMQCPNFESPINLDAAELYEADREKYDETLKIWLKKYADCD